ncbi:MAG: hypothetical protein SFY95_08020 [Planctomycetota bacterium]|nr:hypothetical protein [Planctomycetota bacterium]
MSDGGLASLVACAMAREALLARAPQAGKPAPRVIVWCPSGRGASTRSADEQTFPFALAARRQAQLLDLEWAGDSAPRSADPATSHQAVHNTDDLLAAGRLAMSLGIRTVIWPAHYGSGKPGEPTTLDLDRAAVGADRALLVGRLMSLEGHESGVPSIRIETPLLDLSDRQLAELAVDLGVSISLEGPQAKACWWTLALQEPSRWSSEAIDLATAERIRWVPVLRDAGMTISADTVAGGTA